MPEFAVGGFVIGGAPPRHCGVVERHAGIRADLGCSLHGISYPLAVVLSFFSVGFVAAKNVEMALRAHVDMVVR
jgi:hypothetical protein